MFSLSVSGNVFIVGGCGTVMAPSSGVMKHHTHALLCALFLASACATSSIAKPNKKAPAPLAESDKDFLSKAALGSVYDLALAQLAAGRATEPTLHSYGVELMNDHAQLDSRLLTLGRDKGLALPLTLSDDDKTRLDSLQAQGGSDLDSALVAEFVRVDGEDAQDGRQELSSTQDAAVKRTVTEYVKVEEKHLDSAQHLQKMQALMVIKRKSARSLLLGWSYGTLARDESHSLRRYSGGRAFDPHGSR